MSNKKSKSNIALLLIACIIFTATYVVYFKSVNKDETTLTESSIEQLPTINNNEEYIEGITTTAVSTTLILTTSKDMIMNRTTTIESTEKNLTDSTKITKKETSVKKETTTLKPSTTKEVTTEKPTEEKNTTKKATATTTSYSIPSNGGKFKSYTNYKLLNKSSPQWTKVQCNNNAYTDSNGLRKLGDYYCVAMGSYYTNTLGDLFEIRTENGNFKVIICDFKANAHTDSKNQYTIDNGCVVEFYVDMPTLNSSAKRMGDISYIGDKFAGKIISIVKIGNYFT